MTPGSAVAQASSHFKVETGEMVSLEETDVTDCPVFKDHKGSPKLGGTWTTGCLGTSWTKEWRGHLHQMGKELLS